MGGSGRAVGRRGEGAWVERAERLAARMEALSTSGGEGSIRRVAEEAGLSVAMTRRYLDAYDHVRQFPPGTVAISLNGFEHFKTLQKIDPLRAAAARDAVLAGEIPLSRIQDAIRDARVRAAAPLQPLALPIDVIIDRFRASGRVSLPHHEMISVPAGGETWIGLSADATLMEATDEGDPYLRYMWALVLSPDLPGSPLAGLSFEAFLLRVAAAAAIYEHVSAFCSSTFERDEVSRAAQTWWPSRMDRLSVL